VVRVSGDLLDDAAPGLAGFVTEELTGRPGLLVIDLSDVTRIDTAGVDALVSAAGRAGESDIPLCLVGVQGQPVGTALEEADLTELFEIFASLSDA
jgi:anti-anti-sigma factor